MNFESSYVFPEFKDLEEHDEEIEFICKGCKYHFQDDSLKPFFLPCSDLICENCMNVAKSKDSFNCPECKEVFQGGELNKVQYNREILKLLKKNKRMQTLAKKFSYLNISGM